jgi:hypothetical protein
MLDTVVAAIGGATVATAAVGIILKSIFDRTLDSKYKALEEKLKIQFAEETRRQGKIFDSQIEPLRLFVALVYKIRNLTRALAVDQKLTENKIRELDSLVKDLRANLHESRALLPEDVFEILHGTIGKTLGFRGYLLFNSGLVNHREQKRLQMHEQHKPIEVLYQELDMSYGYLLIKIQEHLGISNDKKPII